MERGQITELLTRYGKIDVIWFDGTPPIPNPGTTVLSLEEIRKLQPGIVINSRFHGHGDFITPEGKLSDTIHLKSDEWGEFCSSWGSGWAYTGWKCRPINEVIASLISARAAGVNNLLDIGPMADGNLSADIYDNIGQMGDWMKVNGEAVHGTRALQGEEKASVPATSKGVVRYLYLIPLKKGSKEPASVSIAITGLHGTYQAKILGSDQPLTITTTGDTMNITVPQQTTKEQTVRVVKLSPIMGS